jgi:hypothetical protein
MSILKATGAEATKYIINPLWIDDGFCTEPPLIKKVVSDITCSDRTVESDSLQLSSGRLSFLKEPAGKVRVIAIVDCWTQSALTGLHKSLSTILSAIEQDGTFDQGKPLRLLMERKLNNLYSYDLTSATDRLPVSLQVQVLSYLFNDRVAQAWRTLLTDREFLLSKNEYGLVGSVRYAVGQPMGCLSSFNMMAFCHHIIVKIAASRVGVSDFKDYSLLGDDIVIGDSLVAKSYENIMSNLGLVINPHKSLVSTIGVCEFAKRLVSKEDEFTPLGSGCIVGVIKH